jgi:hypothetical protein
MVRSSIDRCHVAQAQHDDRCQVVGMRQHPRAVGSVSGMAQHVRYVLAPVELTCVVPLYRSGNPLAQHPAHLAKAAIGHLRLEEV